jgi:hypothetical protein
LLGLYLGFGWFNEHLSIWIYFCYHSCINLDLFLLRYTSPAVNPQARNAAIAVGFELELIQMPLHCSSMYLGGAQDDALSCYDSSSPDGSMSNYSSWATAVDDESTIRQRVPAREQPGRGDERTRRSTVRGGLVVLVLGLGAGAAASRILAATAHAHSTGAAGDGGKVEDLGRGREDDVALWDSRVGKEIRETAEANCVLGMKIFLLNPQ